MRQAQIALFILGTAAFIASAFGAGPHYGELMYKTGLALLLIDVVCVLLWPKVQRP